MERLWIDCVPRKILIARSVHRNTRLMPDASRVSHINPQLYPRVPISFLPPIQRFLTLETLQITSAIFPWNNPRLSVLNYFLYLPAWRSWIVNKGRSATGKTLVTYLRANESLCARNNLIPGNCTVQVRLRSCSRSSVTRADFRSN